MASAAQTAANRENAKHPRTVSDATKESLRTRAMTHGLTTKLDTNTVLRVEDKQEFETILNALLSDATLGSAEEILLIKMQAESFWKLQRAGRMEAGALDVSLLVEQMKETVARDLKPEDLGFALATAFREQSQWFDKLRRYSTTAERTFFKATRELAMIRKAGPLQPIGYDPQSAKPEQTEEAPTQPEPEIGCDPQKPASQHPGAKPRPELGGLSRFAFIQKLENMSESDAFKFFDTLNLPPGQNLNAKR